MRVKLEGISWDSLDVIYIYYVMRWDDSEATRVVIKMNVDDKKGRRRSNKYRW